MQTNFLSAMDCYDVAINYGLLPSSTRTPAEWQQLGVAGMMALEMKLLGLVDTFSTEKYFL